MRFWWFTFTLVFLCFKFIPCESVRVSQITLNKVKRAIRSFEEGNPQCVGALFVREWPASQVHGGTSTGECQLVVEWYTSPPILLWDVLYSYPEVIDRLFCPFCLADGVESKLQRSGNWADTSCPAAAYEPRIVYDSSCTVLLVSHIYICVSDHQIPSHHPSILSALPSSVYVPLFLTNRAGFTVDMLTQISCMVDSGLSFHSVEDIVRDQYQQAYWRLRLLYQEDTSRCVCTRKDVEHQPFPDFDQKLFPFPHEKLIRSVFVSYSLLFDEILYNDMVGRTSKWLACDHTFKSAANIGFTRESDGRWIKVMKCVFCVLGTNGEILHWRFTRGESFIEVRGIFEELKTRHDKAKVDVEGIIIDNCCKWKCLLLEIFPNIVVKLDLFHAVQRFVSTLPMEVRLNTDICKAYGLVFRKSNDIGPKRLLPTPDEETLLMNLNSFEQKWTEKIWKGNNILNPAAKKAISNIKVHIQKGCLSDIPAHTSTCGNERLHRHLNNVLKTNKIAMDSAYVRCGRLFFKANNKASCGNSITSPSAHSKSSADFSARAEHFGFADLGHNDEGLVVKETGVAVFKSLDELNADILYKIRECISTSLENHHAHSVRDHTYTENKENQKNIALSVTHSALSFFEIYKGLNDIGATRLLSKSNLPPSIGLANTCSSFLTTFGKSNQCSAESVVKHKLVLSGHLQGFGFELVEVNGDGNCFFSAVAFQLLNLLPLTRSNERVTEHLANIGLTSHMSVPDVSYLLRQLAVREWRGDAAADYASFLPDDIDYFSEVARYERPGFFGGPLGDLMPMVMANVLGIPLGIITAEPSHPLISVCPRGSVKTPTPIFLAYNSWGPGHYDAVSTLSASSSDVNSEIENSRCSQERHSKTILSSKGCRCGQTKPKKKCKKYLSYKRCKCILKFKTCSIGCKCAGKCGGVVCKPRVVKVNKKNTKQPPRAKHTLQMSSTKMDVSKHKKNGCPNFLEVCVLCTIIHFFRSGFINSWDADMIYEVYAGCIDGLLTLGVVIPLRRWTKELVWKKVQQLKKDFEN